MPLFNPLGRQDFNGVRGKEPVVVLTLAGSEVLYAEKYSVRVSYLTQPARFSLTLGVPVHVAGILKSVPPHTPFELTVNGRLLMTGSLDTIDVSSASGIVQVEGRDALAPLHDAYLRQEDTFKDDTYASMVRKVMDKVGLENVALLFSNRANRLNVVGLSSQTGDTRDTASLSAKSGAGGSFAKHAQSQLGERAYEFLKRHLDRAGLFLFAGADGSYILSEPNLKQESLYAIYRSDGAVPEYCTEVLSEGTSYRNDTTNRFSEVFVYTRGEQKRKGRSKSVASCEDKEMIAWGFNRPMILRDVNADTPAKAEFMAKRKVAESRRQGRKLVYAVAGHQTGSPRAATGAFGENSPVRVLWYPDTLVDIHDEKFGIDGTYWIESVTYTGSPESKTLIEVMRPDDLLFGEEPPPDPPTPPTPPPTRADGLPADIGLAGDPYP